MSKYKTMDECCRDSVMSNIVLIAADDQDDFLELPQVKCARIITKKDILSRKLPGILKETHLYSPEKVFVCVKDYQHQYNLLMLQLILFFVGGKNKAFLDPNGKEYVFDMWIFLGLAVPRVIFYVVYGLLLKILIYIVSLIMWVRIRLFGEVKPSEKDKRSVCYLKTDFWHGLKAGGSVTHTKGFINAGVALGYDVNVYSLDELSGFGLRCPVVPIPPGRICYQYPVTFSQLDYNFRFFLKVLRRLRKKRPDFFYIRNPVNNFSAVMLSLYLNVPLILEFNSSSVWISKNWKNDRPSLMTKVTERLNLYGAWRVTVVSSELKRALVSSGIPPVKIKVNPNGVDLTQFNPHVDPGEIRGKLTRNKFLIGFIGIFGQWHGVITLSKSVHRVVQEYPAAHFVIIGGGALRHEMDEIIRKDGVISGVTFVGTVRHEDAHRYLQCCDVLVSPHEDMADGSPFFGSPTKIFEYMAMGKPIVTTAVGQLGEIFRDGENALLVEQRNPEALAQGILRLARDERLRKSLAERAFSDVSRSFTWEKNFLRAIS